MGRIEQQRALGHFGQIVDEHGPFGGKAVMLNVNYGMRSLPIDKDGHVIINGMNLMDPANPIWEGNPPVIAWPDL